jgi:MinD-like ATPase involved in chromosome partitioning or flagellar assembly
MSDPLFAGEPAERDAEPTRAVRASPVDGAAASNGDRGPRVELEAGDVADAERAPSTRRAPVTARRAGSLRDALTGGGRRTAMPAAAAAEQGPVSRTRRPRPILRGEVHHRGPSAIERAAAWLRELLSSPGERAERAVGERLERLPTASRTNLVVLCGPRGGVGKTMVARTVGGILSAATRGIVVLVDGDRDYGPAVDLVPDARRSPKTISDLLADFTEPPPFPRLRPYLSALPDGLLVLAAPADPKAMRTLTPAHYERILALMSGADIVLLDCAGGITGDLQAWALQKADQAVVVTTPDYVAANNVAKVLTADDVQLPERTLLVLNNTRPPGPGDRAAIEAHFERHRLDERVTVPYDRELHAALDQATYELQALPRNTRLPLKRTAASLGEALR